MKGRDDKGMVYMYVWENGMENAGISDGQSQLKEESDINILESIWDVLGKVVEMETCGGVEEGRLLLSLSRTISL